MTLRQTPDSHPKTDAERGLAREGRTNGDGEARRPPRCARP